MWRGEYYYYKHSELHWMRVRHVRITLSALSLARYAFAKNCIFIFASHVIYGRRSRRCFLFWVQRVRARGRFTCAVSATNGIPRKKSIKNQFAKSQRKEKGILLHDPWTAPYETRANKTIAFCLFIVCVPKLGLRKQYLHVKFVRTKSKCRKRYTKQGTLASRMHLNEECKHSLAGKWISALLYTQSLTLTHAHILWNICQNHQLCLNEAGVDD